MEVLRVILKTFKENGDIKEYYWFRRNVSNYCERNNMPISTFFLKYNASDILFWFNQNKKFRNNHFF